MARFRDDRRTVDRRPSRIHIGFRLGSDYHLAEVVDVSKLGALVVSPVWLLPGLLVLVDNRRTGKIARFRVVWCEPEEVGTKVWRAGLSVVEGPASFFSPANESGRQRPVSPMSLVD